MEMDDNTLMCYYGLCVGQDATFAYINTTMNWTNAQSYCREHHTDLASVRNMSENQNVMKLIPAGQVAWIGLYRESWKWVNGRTPTFMYWSSTKPDGLTSNCATAYLSGAGRWEDWSCSAQKAFYHFIYDPKNWTEAQTYCRQTYTDLVTVDSYSTVTTLNRLADAWIGLYFDVIDWKWSLSDEDFYKNNEATYTNWYPGQPDSIWYTEYCGNIYVDQGRWWDTPCDNLLRGNVTFVLITNPMNWTDAQRYCRQHYTDLASVRNLSENAQIQKLITGSTWIGLYKNTWKWSNGPFFMYNYWQSSEPDGGDEKCTAANFANSGRWMDLACGLEKPFVCYHGKQPFTHTSCVKSLYSLKSQHSPHLFSL
uniref:C-type lectin domain-containing protein n=1 Tax=Nothobranchius furzeri TaxID=105023 RepID=A0A8C6M0A5_NOTFU